MNDALSTMGTLASKHILAVCARSASKHEAVTSAPLNRLTTVVAILRTSRSSKRKTSLSDQTRGAGPCD